MDKDFQDIIEELVAEELNKAGFEGTVVILLELKPHVELDGCFKFETVYKSNKGRGNVRGCYDWNGQSIFDTELH